MCVGLSKLLNRHTVCNFKTFVDYVHKSTIFENEVTVSFDVVGLFTSSVLMNKVLGLDLELLVSLSSRPFLNIFDITIGLINSFSFTVFLYKNSYYKQTFDTPLDSYIFPIIASIYMERIEQQLSHLTPAVTLAEICRRYVLHSQQRSRQCL